MASAVTLGMSMLVAPRVLADAPGPALKAGTPRAFSYDALVARASAMAQKPYEALRAASELIQQLDYEQLGKISFKPECALLSPRVEPRGEWGRGAVTLIEIPTDDEIHDNIVAFWTPAGALHAGRRFELSYRLYWQDESPEQRHAEQCVH